MIHELIEGGIAILVLGGLLAVAAWGVTRLLPSLRGGRAGSAEEILRQRFARGEISAEEFQRSIEIKDNRSPGARERVSCIRSVEERGRDE